MVYLLHQAAIAYLGRHKTVTMPTAMIHTVYFWLKDNLSDDDWAMFQEGAEALAAAPTVATCYGGAPAATPEREVTDHSFDYSIHLHFASVADHNAYQTHPIHLKFVEEHAHKFERVLVFDSHC